jgi:hypothetical protein
MDSVADLLGDDPNA